MNGHCTGTMQERRSRRGEVTDLERLVRIVRLRGGDGAEVGHSERHTSD